MVSCNPLRPGAAASRRDGTATRATRNSHIREINRQIVTKQRSAVEVTKQYLDQLQKVEGAVNSFITIDADFAIKQAAAIDVLIAKEGTKNLGALAAVPIAIKDNLCTAGTRTTAGSKILENYVPAYDATSVARLRSAGAVFVGKTNMDEFGMGSSTENSAYKPTSNPWDVRRVPGGSSGGSAAAVAAQQCVAALGTDTGGSIRQPAHFCGVVGLKPSYGRVSRYGLIAYASSLDCVGPMTHSVEDAALLLNAIAGPDPADSTSSQAHAPEDFTAKLTPADQLASTPLLGVKVGLVRETTGEGVEAGVSGALDAAIKHLTALGAEVEEVSLPTFSLGLPAYYVLALSEASSNLSRYDGVRYGVRAATETLSQLYTQSRGDGLGEEVKRRILMGTYALSAGYIDAYYTRAQQVRTLVQREMVDALAKYDVLLTPTAPSTAYKIGEKSKDPLAMYKGDLMTVNVNLSGLPAIVVPSAYVSTEGVQLPCGIQMIGRMFGEADLLRVAHVFEQTIAHGVLTPSLLC